MKRRVFLSTAGTAGVIGAVSGASVISSFYSGLSESVALKEFSPEAKKALDEFVLELATNVKEQGLKDDYISSVAMPVRIIKKEFNKSKQQIVYKNKLGNYIELSVVDKRNVVRISNTI